jgi:quercetin dioxygenase-like cupin family protein
MQSVSRSERVYGGNVAVLGTAESRVLVENPQVRVTSWHFESGDTTGPHRHEYPYVVVPVTGGRFVVLALDGASTEMHQVPGSAYDRPAGVEHEVRSDDGQAVVFVEIELLSGTV